MSLFKTKEQCQFYTETQKHIDYTSSPIKEISTDYIKLSILHNNQTFILTITNFTHGIFHIEFDLPDKTLKYKTRTNLGQSLQRSPFTEIQINSSYMKLSTTDISTSTPFFASNPQLNTYHLIITFPSFTMQYFLNQTHLFSFNTHKTLNLLYKHDGYLNSNSCDFTFHNIPICIGLPERPSNLYLKDGAYRLYNTDDNNQTPGSLSPTYGSVPMINGINNEHIITIINNNASDQWIEIKTNNNDKQFTWITEGGVLSLYLFSDSDFNRNAMKTAKVSGYAPLPPIFVFGYHQSRWGYNGIKDAHDVALTFDKMNIPYDVMWLDIEHTNDKRYFTWDESKFNKTNTKAFIQYLKDNNRHLVTIIDPHIKKDENYFVYSLLKQNDCLVKTKNGSDFTGHCWPGTSVYVDFLNYDKVLPLYKQLFTNENYFMNFDNIHTWIDMNEPSVFDERFEMSMSKTEVHNDGIVNVSHAEVHNIYGYFYHKVAYEALKHRYHNQYRPFVLSRSFYAGSQQYGFIWTGDQKATEGFMHNSIETNIINGLCGISACGTDVGGFLLDTPPQLMKDWYELGLFYTFYRGHSEITTKRREPWCFPNDICDSISHSIKLRYHLLMYYYTCFYKYANTGISILKPLWMCYRKYFTDLISISHAGSLFVYGNELLGINYYTICDKALTVVNAMIQSNEMMLYKLDTGIKVNAVTKHEQSKMIGKFVIGGNIIPYTYDIGKCSYDVMRNPLSLKVYVDKDNKAEGNYYLDDGRSIELEGHYLYLYFAFDNGKMKIGNMNIANEVMNGPIKDIIPYWNTIEIHGYNNNNSVSIGDVNGTQVNVERTPNNNNDSVLILNIRALNIKVVDVVNIILQ